MTATQPESATFAAPEPLRVSVSAGEPSVVVWLRDPRPWASPAMDLDAFREARDWMREGWAL